VAVSPLIQAAHHRGELPPRWSGVHFVEDAQTPVERAYRQHTASLSPRAIIAKVVARTPPALGSLSLCALLSRATRFSPISVQRKSRARHWSTAATCGHITSVAPPNVAAAAEMPVSVLPAPQGSTVTPLRARPADIPKIARSAAIWWGRCTAVGSSFHGTTSARSATGSKYLSSRASVMLC
jgi:hypothetical protein